MTKIENILCLHGYWIPWIRIKKSKKMEFSCLKRFKTVLYLCRMDEECVTVNDEVCSGSTSSGSAGARECKTVYEQQCSTRMETVMETTYKNECSTVPEQVGRSMSSSAPPRWRQ
jgi:hypothetical protein